MSRPNGLWRNLLSQNGGYRVHQDVRQLVLFTHHDPLADYPFVHLDLTVSGKRLHDLSSDAQRVVLERFHFGLKSNGVLLLRPDEAIEVPAIFQSEDERLRSYVSAKFRSQVIAPFSSTGLRRQCALSCGQARGTISAALWLPGLGTR